MLTLAACSSLDKTDIRPGDRIAGPGITFTVPTNQSWFAVDYGTSNHVKISQLNYEDSFSIEAFLNKGPRKGMFKSRKQHLAAIVNDRKRIYEPEGYTRLSHNEWINPDDPKLCVRYSLTAEDWRGRNNAGPALLETFGIVCAHPLFPNALSTLEITRRFEQDAPLVNMEVLAESVFHSIQFVPL